MAPALFDQQTGNTSLVLSLSATRLVDNIAYRFKELVFAVNSGYFEPKVFRPKLKFPDLGYTKEVQTFLEHL